MQSYMYDLFKVLASDPRFNMRSCNLGLAMLGVLTL